MALTEIRDIGEHQNWYPLRVGDAHALAIAVKAARGSGAYGSLALSDRNALDAATEIPEFAVEPLARDPGLDHFGPAGPRGVAFFSGRLR